MCQRSWRTCRPESQSAWGIGWLWKPSPGVCHHTQHNLCVGCFVSNWFARSQASYLLNKNIKSVNLHACFAATCAFQNPYGRDWTSHYVFYTLTVTNAFHSVVVNLKHIQDAWGCPRCLYENLCTWHDPFKKKGDFQDRLVEFWRNLYVTCLFYVCDTGMILPYVIWRMCLCVCCFVV